MSQRDGSDRNRRRRKLLIVTTYLSFGGYCIAESAALLAKIFGFSSMTYTQMLTLLVPCVGITLFFLLLFYTRSGFSSPARSRAFSPLSDVRTV